MLANHFLPQLKTDILELCRPGLKYLNCGQQMWTWNLSPLLRSKTDTKPECTTWPYFQQDRSLFQRLNPRLNFRRLINYAKVNLINMSIYRKKFLFLGFKKNIITICPKVKISIRVLTKFEKSVVKRCVDWVHFTSSPQIGYYISFATSIFVAPRRNVRRTHVWLRYMQFKSYVLYTFVCLFVWSARYLSKGL